MGNRKFEVFPSERIIEIKKLHLKGTEVFGINEYFEQWMNSKVVTLGNIGPIEL